MLFDHDKRAVGVQFDRFSHAYIVRVRREVILSAGAINSPQLLMLSGIGPRKHLRDIGVRLTDADVLISLLTIDWYFHV